MTNSHATLEEIGTSTGTPTFIGEVECLATAVDDYLVRYLRVEVHPETYTPSDFLQEIPDFVLRGNLSQEAVAGIVRQYLSQTDTAEKVTGIKRDRFSDTNPITENTSFFPHTRDNWRARHYPQKDLVDRLVDNLRIKFGELACSESEKIAQQLGLDPARYLPRPSLNGTLAHSLAQYTQDLYREAGVLGEEPLLLYQLCFQALAEAKGWDKLEDKELLKVLDAEGIPVKEFTDLTDREIKLSAEPVIEVGGNRTQILSPRAVIGRCELVSANSWFSALQELLRQGSGKTIEINGQTYVRPFTLKENLQARIEDYTLKNPDGSERDLEERQRFFSTWLDSCSGIHHLARTTRFKIIPQSPQLITLAQAPTNHYLAVPYAQTQGRELDSAARRVKYNCSLSRAEVLEHPAWLAAAEEDRVLLGGAFDVMRAVKNASADWRGMGFYVYPNKPQDELRPLFVNDHGWGGYANGGGLLLNGGRFLRR